MIDPHMLRISGPVSSGLVSAALVMASNHSLAAFADPQMDSSALAKYMVFNQEVKDAIAQKKPIVALESTGTSLFVSALHSY